MALKPGRVGVAPSQVDLFGNIINGGSGGDSYTKQEADAKFETQTHAADTFETKSVAAATYETKANAQATYETKSDAAQLQPKTLALPIHMLHGTVLSVEGMFAGDQAALTNKELTDSLDEWSSASLVQSDNTVTFTGLNDTYGYDLYCSDKLIGISSISKTGSGDNVTLVYTVTGATAGDSCKLRIVK